MPNEVENAIKSAATQIAKYVEDVAEMKVETKYVEVGANNEADFAQAKPGAQTVVKLDGDSETIVPLRRNQTGQLEVDTDLYELHQRNVQTAIDYRHKMLQALLDVLKARMG